MYGDDILANTKKLKSKANDNMFSGNGNITGAGIGVVAGVAIAYNQKANIFLGGLIGGILGAVITNYFVSKND
jgi:hypothetical protein